MSVQSREVRAVEAKQAWKGKNTHPTRDPVVI
jgi:hypothetical protein